MPKKSPNRANEDLLFEDGKWDDLDDVGTDPDFDADDNDLRLNVQARRLYDRYQDERRLRELLEDQFDY